VTVNLSPSPWPSNRIRIGSRGTQCQISRSTVISLKSYCPRAHKHPIVCSTRTTKLVCKNTLQFATGCRWSYRGCVVRQHTACRRPMLVDAFQTSPPAPSHVRRRESSSRRRRRSLDTRVDFRWRNDRARTATHARTVAAETLRSNAAEFYAVTACACIHTIILCSLDNFSPFVSKQIAISNTVGCTEYRFFSA